ARVGAQGLNRLAVPPDYDGLLRLPLDEQRYPNVYRTLGFAKLLHFGGKGVRDLIFEQREGGFTEVFDHKEPERLGSDLVGLELERPLGEPGPDPGQEPI